MATRRTARPISRPQTRTEPLEPRWLLAAAPSLASAGDVDVAYDTTGTLHLAYYDTAEHNLKYAARSSAGDWTDPVVVDASSADTGAQVSIAIDPAGLPGVAYRDATNLDLKFAHRDAAGTWTAQMVDGKGRIDAGVLPDLAFDGSGAPVISYYRPTGTGLRLATLSAGRWKIRALARAGGPGRAATGVAVNPATGQWAATYQSSDGAVRYAAMTGRKVRKFLVDRLTRGASGASPSVDFTADGTPGLSYYDVLRQHVQVAHPQGTAWISTAVAATNGQGTGPTILIDRSTGEAHVVFRDPAGGNTIAAGPLTGTVFPLRDLTSEDDLVVTPQPSPAMDPVGHVIVAAYPGSAVGVVASLPAATGFAFSNVTTDSMRISWTDLATTETGYEVQRSDDVGQTFAVVGTVAADTTQFDITGLTEGRAFWFRVVTFDGAGNRTASATVFDETLALAPTNVAATAVSTSRVDLTWQDNSQMEHLYRVDRRIAGTASWQTLAFPPANSTGYSDTSVAPGTAYEYRVGSAVSSDVNFCPTTATATTPVAAPQSLTADDSIALNILLTWPDVDGETGYQIERAPGGSGTFTVVGTTGADDTAFLDEDLPEDVTYDYRVRSVGSGGPTDPSEVASATVRLSSPGILGAIPLTQNSLTLTWADNSAVESNYEVDASLNNGPFANFATLPAGSTSYDAMNLAASTTYRFRVRARGTSADSDFSTTIEYSVAAAAPAQLTALQLAGGTKMDLLWKDTNAGKAAYKVERSKDGGTFSEIAIVSPGQNHYVDSGLKAAAVYRYRVRSAGPWGMAGYSNVAKEMDPRPTNVTATVMSQTQVKVVWTDNCPRESSYEVRYSDGSRTRTMKSGANAKGLTIRGLTPGGHYMIEVVAVQDASHQWGAEPVIAVMLVAPTGVTAGVGDAMGLDLSSAVTVTWDDVNLNEGGYGIERSTDGGKTFEFLADVGPNVTSYTDRDVPEDTAWQYRVYGYNLAGVGATSAPAANVPATWLNAPTGLVATVAGPSEINLDWTDNSGRETGYVIAMSLDGHQFFQLTDIDNHATSYTVTRDMNGEALQFGTTYFFWVIARNTNNASDYSNVADVTL